MASIAKRPNGQWRARYRDEVGKEHARHFTRKIDAQRWLDEVTAAVITGAYIDPEAGRITFDAWFQRWSASQQWAPMTQVQADLVRRSLPFADLPLGQLRNSHLQSWVKDMATTKGYAPNTIATRVQTVRAALRAAIRDRRLNHDPTVGLSLPRRRARERTMQVATSEEVGRLLAACEPRMKAFVGLCAFAGLRLGEASGVKTADVDFLRRRLEVVRQVQKRRGGPSEIRRPKYESERTVFLPNELLRMLSWHLEHHGTSADGWLFVGTSGQPIPPTTVNYWWTRTTKAASAPVKIHALRHFYASGLIAAGCDVVTVQRSLGHKSPSVTLDTYSHLWPSAEDRTRQAADDLAADALAHARADSPRTGTDQ